MEFANEFLPLLERLKAALTEADTVLIGAGAGLSTSAGFTYSGERFEKHFADFRAKYGFSDMYTGGFYPYTTLEERWAYWSRYIMINRYADAPKPVYENLRKLIDGKNYFVLTTNVDHCFQKAGFDKARLFYTQGDYGLFQCSVPCHQNTYDNEAQVRTMYEQQHDMKIPKELIPYCPVCGKPMSMNLRADDTFVEDAGWQVAAQRYADFLTAYKNSRILFLELGVGANTPGIIKYPFQHMAAHNPQSVYVCINYGEAFSPQEIEQRSICINGDIGEVITELIEQH
ncbi:Sir2 silent information regulator family NAD-dependent deacetylase [Treponema medium]|uniref:SIR2 family NAD-dependent protein deacylase n=1 Tax=Treponema medium TaxID=58231 RepID=UPI00197E46F2|nr:Sir2 family NAD-dependent protein deacetylase [Treponema medium]QSH93447.1 Sir2 silent information regulator family NAD-dependent deacetylase [Treponema medium]